MVYTIRFQSVMKNKERTIGSRYESYWLTNKTEDNEDDHEMSKNVHMMFYECILDKVDDPNKRH